MASRRVFGNQFSGIWELWPECAAVAAARRRAAQKRQIKGASQTVTAITIRFKGPPNRR